MNHFTFGTLLSKFRSLVPNKLGQANSSARYKLLSFALISFISLTLSQPPLVANDADQTIEIGNRLVHGKVIVDSQEVGETRFVTGRIIINEPPSKVWPVMTNPFEFKGRISPRVREVEVLTDRTDMSLLRMHINYTFFFPHLTYVVESHYSTNSHIDFKRVEGIFRDFRGSWHIDPIEGGNKTQLTYAMYIDPGFAIPQWIVREAIKAELPRTLIALRQRITDINEKKQSPESRSIMAATATPTCLALPNTPGLQTEASITKLLIDKKD